MANSDMVAKTNESTNSSTNTFTENKDDTDPPEQSRSNTSTVSASRANNLPLVWKCLEEQGISAGASNIIVQSWRQGTAKQYRSYLQKWELYCNKRKIDPIHPTILDGINFLSSLFESGIGYNAINTARSALSSILLLPGNVSFGSHPLATRLLKGVFELRPSLSKYQDTWEISVVLKVLDEWKLEDSSLKVLSLKLSMRFEITTSQRLQTLKSLCINKMNLKSDQCSFEIDVLLKTSQPGKHLNKVVIAAYPGNKNVRPVQHLKSYMKKTSTFREKHIQLFVSFRKPNNPVSADTLARWIKTVMHKAGINTVIYGAHSTKAASTSAAHRKHIDTNKILAAAGWTNETTFSKFYNKTIVDVTKSMAKTYCLPS